MTSDLDPAWELLSQLLRISTEAQAQRYDRAMELADEALLQCERSLSDPEGVFSAAEASIAANAFGAARAAGQARRALAYAKREYAATAKHPKPATLARALNNRGLAHHELNELVDAEADYREGLRIIEQSDDRDLSGIKATLRSHLGQLLTTRGQDQEAVQALVQNPPSTAFRSPFLLASDPELTLWNDQASVALSSGDWKSAEEYLRKALEHPAADKDAKIKGILVCNLAEVLHRSGRDEEAIAKYREAITIHASDQGSKVELATDYLNLASIYQTRGTPDQALDAFKSAWDAVRESSPRSLVALRALWGVGLHRMVQKDYTRARAAITRGLDLYEEMRPDVAITESGHTGFLSAYRSLLEMGMYLALQQSWPDELRSFIERGKSRFALERMARANEKPSFKSPSNDIDRIAGVDGLLLNFFVGPNATFVAYQLNQSPGGFRLDAGETEVSKMVSEFRDELLSSSRRAASGAAGARLGSFLFKKLSVDITRIRAIYFLPDGPLWYVPFDALPLPPQLSGVPKLLGTVAPSSYVPSVSILKTLRSGTASPARRKDWNVIAFGEPENEPPFVPLPGTVQELDHLEQLANGSFSLTIRRRAAATRESFLELAPSATHIHVAAHAVADFESEQPYIVFSGTGSTQFLRSGELAALRLRADVVFLSACSTSVGRKSTGEGVMSLARSFLWSGCRCVIASLWPMPDGSAPLIVNAFYSALAAGVSPAQAAQIAREQRRLEGRKPSLWAGFQVLGDGDAWSDRHLVKYLTEKK